MVAVSGSLWEDSAVRSAARVLLLHVGHLHWAVSALPTMRLCSPILSLFLTLTLILIPTADAAASSTVGPRLSKSHQHRKMSDVTVLGICTDNLVTVLQPAPSVQCISCGPASPITTTTAATYTTGTTNIYTLGPLCGPAIGYISLAAATTGTTTATIHVSAPPAWASTTFVPANQPATTIALPFQIIGTGDNVSVVIRDDVLTGGPYSATVVVSSSSPGCCTSSSCC
jgi:hypothetical protein